MRYEPISDQEAEEQIAIGMHTGLRKGSEAPDSAKLWKTISESKDSSWSDAARYTVYGLKAMGYAIVKEVKKS